MDEFGPLLILILAWIFVGLPAAVVKKAKEQKTAEKLSRGARPRPDIRTGGKPVPVSAEPAAQPKAFSESAPRLQPTVSVTPHDASI